MTFTVTDDDGGANSDNFTVTVDNVAPTATLANDGPVDEGSPATITFSAPPIRRAPTPAPASATPSTATAPTDLAASYARPTARTTRPAPSTTTALHRLRPHLRQGRRLHPVHDGRHRQQRGADRRLENDGPVDEGSPATITSAVPPIRPAPTPAPASATPSTAAAPMTWRPAMPRPHRRTTRPAPSTTTARFTVYGRIFDKDDGYTQYSTVVTVTTWRPRTSRVAMTRPSTRADLGQPERHFTDPGMRRHPHLRLARGRRQRPDHHQRHRPELQLHAHRQRQLVR